MHQYPISRCILGLLPITVSSPGGGAAFNKTQFSREELLTYDERFQTEHCTTTLSELQFNVYLLLSIHVVFYCSLRLAPRCPASTLVLSNSWSTRTIAIIHAWGEVKIIDKVIVYSTKLKWRSVASIFNVQYSHFLVQTTRVQSSKGSIITTYEHL